MLDINLDSLESLFILSKHLNFSKAADELGYTQQALSYQISQLEDKLGVVIFHRLPQGLKITEQGQNILQELPQFFQLLGQTKQDFNHYDAKGASDKLHVFYSNGWDCDHLMAEFLISLANSHSELKIDFQWVLQEQLESKLIENPHCVGLGYLPLNSDVLETHEVFTSPAVLAAHPDNITEPPLIAFSQTHIFPFSKVLKDLHYDYDLEHILGPRRQKVKFIVDSTSEYKTLAIENKGTIFTHYKAIEDALLENKLKIFETFPEHLCKGYIHWHTQRTHKVSGKLLFEMFQTCLKGKSHHVRN